MIRQQNNSSCARACFSLNSLLMIIKQQFYLAQGHISPSYLNLLTNLIILKCMLWEWVWQDLSFVSNQLKKVYKAWIRLESRALSAPFWCLWQKLSLFFTVIKLFLKFWVPEAVSLVPKLHSLLQRSWIWHHSPEAITSKTQARYF